MTEAVVRLEFGLVVVSQTGEFLHVLITGHSA